jgi:hypothetical protein
MAGISPPVPDEAWREVDLALTSGVEASARDVERARVLREVNLSIYQVAERIDPDGSLFDFFCECGSEDCLALVCMTLGEFRQRAVVGEILARPRGEVREIRARHHAMDNREGRQYRCRTSGCGSVVLVDEAAESIMAMDLAAV